MLVTFLCKLTILHVVALSFTHLILLFCVCYQACLQTSTEPRPTWPEAGKIELNSYSVRYREGLNCVLKGIDISIRPGEKVNLSDFALLILVWFIYRERRHCISAIHQVYSILSKYFIAL